MEGGFLRAVKERTIGPVVESGPQKSGRPGRLNPDAVEEQTAPDKTKNGRTEVPTE